MKGKLKRKVLFAIILLMMAVLFGCSIVEENDGNILTSEEKLEDFQYMYKIIEENYPYIEVNKRLNNVDWLANKESYEESIIKTNNDKDFFKALQKILRDLHNGHVYMEDKNTYQYVLKTYKKAASDYEANDIMIDYNVWVRELEKERTIDRYGKAPEADKDADKISKEVIEGNIKKDIIEKDKLAYLRIGSFNHFNIDKDVPEIKEFLKEVKDYPGLAIDIRGNSGGSTYFWNEIVQFLLSEPVEHKTFAAYRGGTFVENFIYNAQGKGYERIEPIEKLREYNLSNLPEEIYSDFKYFEEWVDTLTPSNDSIKYKGRIFLLVDNVVFSTSEAFSVFAKDTGFATLIGERTGGDRIGGDPAVCSLPNSGYVFAFTKELGLNYSGEGNFEHKTTPEYQVDAAIYNDLKIDKAVKKALELLDN